MALAALYTVWDGNAWVEYQFHAFDADKLGGQLPSYYAVAHSHPYRPDNWVPAWSDITSKPSTNAGFGIADVVVGNSGGTAGTWTGTLDGLTAYYNGLTIRYNILTAGASTTTLNLNSLGAIEVHRYTTSSKITTHFSVGAVITMTYLNSKWIVQDWYDSTSDYEVRWQNNVTFGEACLGYHLLMEGADGKFYPVTSGGNSPATNNTVTSAELRIGGIMLYYGTSTDVSANANTGAYYLYESHYNSEGDYWNNKSSGWATAYRPFYIVGSLNGNGNFVLDGAGGTGNSFLTQTLPSSDDGKLYIRIGIMENTYDAWRLETRHPIYQYKDGALRMYVPTHAHAYRADTWVPNASDITGLDTTHRWLTDAYISTWNGKADAHSHPYLPLAGGTMNQDTAIGGEANSKAIGFTHRTGDVPSTKTLYVNPGGQLIFNSVAISLVGHAHAWSEITSKPTTFAPIIGSGAGDAVAGNDSRLTNERTPVNHNLVDTTKHPVSGLTTGHFLKALGPTSYGFAAHGLTAADVGARSTSWVPAASDVTGLDATHRWLTDTYISTWNGKADAHSHPYLPLAGGTMDQDTAIGGEATSKAIGFKYRTGDVQYTKTLYVDNSGQLVFNSVVVSQVGHTHSYEPTISAGTNAQYWRGDKSWQTLDKSAVGLGNVVNLDTSNPANIVWTASYRSVTDTEKSTWNGKQNALTAGFGDSINPYASKTANYVLAAPDGSNGSPSFRLLVAADIPSLDAAKIGSGTVATARLGSGTPSAAKALLGDQSWGYATVELTLLKTETNSSTSAVSSTTWTGGFTAMDAYEWVLIICDYYLGAAPAGTANYYLACAEQLVKPETAFAYLSYGGYYKYGFVNLQFLPPSTTAYVAASSAGTSAVLNSIIRRSSSADCVIGLTKAAADGWYSRMRIYGVKSLTD